MSDLLTGRTLLEELCAASGTGGSLVLTNKFVLRKDLMDGSTRPVQELTWADAKGIVINRAEKAFIRFPVLSYEPVCLWKCYDPDKVHENACNNNHKCDSEYVLEITTG